MSAIKYAVPLLAAIAIGALLPPDAVAQTAPTTIQVVTNNESSLNLAGQGLLYKTTSNGTIASVETDGFLFCANVGTVGTTAITLAPTHATWTLPTAQDVQTFVYGGGGALLAINRGKTTSLVCHSVNAEGRPMTPFGDGLFYDNFGDKYPYVTNNTREVLSASANGLHLNTDGTATIAPIMLTQPDSTTGTKAINYMFRVGASCSTCASGGPAGAQPTMAQLRAMFAQSTSSTGGTTASTTSASGPQVNLRVLDAWDTNYLSANATWCTLSQLPNPVVYSTICSGPNVIASGSVSGKFDLPFGLNAATGYNATFYVVVGRSVTAQYPTATPTTPLAAAMIFSDPSVPDTEQFTADDTTFAYLPGSAGPSWIVTQ